MLISSWDAIYSGGLHFLLKKCAAHSTKWRSKAPIVIIYNLSFYIWGLFEPKCYRITPDHNVRAFSYRLKFKSSTENWLKLLKYIQLTMPLNMQKPVARMRYAANIKSIGLLKSPFFCTSWTTCNTGQGWWVHPAPCHCIPLHWGWRGETSWNITSIHWFQRQKDFHLKRWLQTL